MRGMEPPGVVDAPRTAVLLAQLQATLGAEAEPVKSWLAANCMATTDVSHCSQRSWSDQVAKVRRAALVAGASGRDRFLLDQQTGTLASGWMAVAPVAQAQTSILAVQYR